MPTVPRNVLSKISKELLGSVFQNYRLENKLPQELGLE